MFRQLTKPTRLLYMGTLLNELYTLMSREPDINLCEVIRPAWKSVKLISLESILNTLYKCSDTEKMRYT